MRRIFMLLGLVLLGTGCGSDPGPEPVTATVITSDHLLEVDLSPGVRTVLVGPGSRPLRLTVAVPDPAPSGLAPLVLALHWAAPGSPHLAEQYVRSFAAPGLSNLNAIIIAPEATSTNWTGDAVARTLASLVRAALGAWPVDSARVVVTGYSMGGVGTWYLVSLYPELFSAAIPVAGEPTAVLTPAVPLLAIHGDQDEVYPLVATRQAVETLQLRGGRAQLLIVPGSSHAATAAYLPYLDQAVTWLTDEVWGGP